MPRPALSSSTGRSIVLLFVFVCGLPLGCGTLSHRTAARDDAELEEIASTQDRDAATRTLSRRPWRSPELDENLESPPEHVALTSAEESVEESVDSATEAETAAVDSTQDLPVAADNARSSGLVEEVGTARFETEVLGSDRPVLVDFYADWCGPCKQLTPVLDELAADTPDVKIVRVNIDESRKLAKAYQVSSVPTLMVFKQGEMVSHHRGLANRKTLDKLLAR
ncbi:MAG: thioredoxin [Pirellulaceae bacterium]